MTYLGFQFVCAKGHRKTEAYPPETRKWIRPDDFRFKQCETEGCDVLAYGVPIGLEVVSPP